MNKIQQIAFVSDAVMPYHIGGKERRLYEISKRLAHDDREVHIYTMKWWDGSEKTVWHEGVCFHAISKLYPLYVNNRRSMKEAIMFGLATFKLIFVKFDVLDVDHMPFFPLFSARIVAWLKGKKMYATWHEVWGREYWKEYIHGMAGFFGYIIEQISFMLPDVIISNSEHTTAQLRRSGVKKQIETISLGADLESIYSAKPASERSDVIFVGRLLNHKNAGLLVKAITIIKKTAPKIKCNIIGDGPEKPAIIQLIKELHLKNNVKILDAVRDCSHLYGLMKASKMLVLPSVREGFGLVVVEANAAGLPVITTSHRNNAAKDLINEGVNGLLVEPNENDIAEKIIKILEIRETMEPTREVDRYDWRLVVKKMERVLRIKQPEIYQNEHKINSQIYTYKASIIILTKNSSKTIKDVLDAVFKQNLNNFEVICIDCSSADDTINIIKKYPAKIINIKPEEFGHGKTRNYAANLAQGEFVVFLTHDSVPEKDNWLEEMIKPFFDMKVVGVYGRQVPRPNENIIDKHFQLSLYSNKDIIWEKNNWKQGDNIFSDANSAVRKSMILEHPYNDDIIVSEDYEWAVRILKLGFKIVYSANARVVHSHSYNIKNLFKRNFDVGVSYRTIYTKKESMGFFSKGIKIVFQELKYLHHSGHSILIPVAIFRNAVRFFAIQLGKREYLFTKNFKHNHLSVQTWYWKKYE